MTSEELIELAVHEHNGLWPKNITTDTSEKEVLLICIKAVEHYEVNDFAFGNTSFSKEYFNLVCDRKIFEFTARELGYINSYRWGIVYPNKFSKPDLPSHILISMKRKDEWSEPDFIYEWGWASEDNTFFRIVDPKYKPSNCNYLDTHAPLPKKNNEPSNKVILLESLSQLTEKELDIILLSKEGIVLQKYVLDIIEKHEKEKQRKLVIDKAYKIYSDEQDTYTAFEKLYNLGYLVKPKE